MFTVVAKQLAIAYNIGSRIYSIMSSTSETKEAAFLYAFATATVIHTVAEECAKHEGKNLGYCGCDSTLKNEMLEPGKEWGGCSPDLNFSINFAKQLLNGTILDNATSEQHKIFISHNSKIGQVVSSIASYKDGYR